MLFRTLECRKLLLHLTEPLDPLTVPSLSPLTDTHPKLWSPLFCALFLQSQLFSPHREVRTHASYCPMPGLFHLTQGPLVTFMLLQNSTPLWLRSVPLHLVFHCIVWYSTVLCLLYSSFDGQLGGLCMLALGSRAAMIVVVQMFS